MLLVVLLPVPAAAEVRFGDDVTAETRWYVDTALARARVAFAAHVPDSDAFDPLVVIVTNPEDAAAEWAAERGISIARAERLFLARSGHYAGLATTGFTVIINDNYGDAGATIHEFTHLVQRELAGGPSGPRWLSEGGAEYFDMLIAHDWGIDAGARHPRVVNREVAGEWAATVANCRGGLLPAAGETCDAALGSLHRLESGTRFDTGGGAISPYARAAIAFQVFVDRHGEEAYFCFLTEQGAGSSWRAAFSTCTGETVAEFYDHFDWTRDRGFIRETPSRRVAYD